MKVNPDIFFKFHQGKFVVWNYRAHEQFELTLPYVQRLYEIGTGEGATSAEQHAPVQSEPVHVVPVAPTESGAAQPSSSGGLSSSELDRELRDADLVSASYPDVQWGWDSLSHIFHFGTNSKLAAGTELPREDSSAVYVEQCEAVDAEAPEVIPAVAGEVFRLPAPDVAGLKQISLWDALMARKTTREFTGEPIALAVVSDILHATFGAVHGPDRSDVDGYGIQSYGYRRTSPSGGGLQVAEPYVVNLTVSGLPVGVYHYHSINHTLTRIESELPAVDLGPLLAGQNFANDLGFAIFMVARFDKMWWKYPHSRSYRVALMDVGHLSQTFHLACTGYGLRTWLTGVFYDDEIARRLKLDTTHHGVMLMVGAGNGEGRAINRGILEALRVRR